MSYGWERLPTLVALFSLFLARHSGVAQLCNSSPPVEEIESVIDIFKATDGDGWLHPWPVDPIVENNNPCDYWYGVSCNPVDNNTCHVVGISLQNNSLAGTIPESIGGLSYMRSLYLSENRLIGTIPKSIGNLSQLTIFEAFGNQLSGSIPSTVGNLSQLQTLLLNENRLTRSVPDTICQLTQLIDLELQTNRLTGSIPQRIGEAKSLQFLSLDENELTGSIPFSIGKLVQLKRLTMTRNHLFGSIPSSIGNLSSLEELIFIDNYLSGTIPDTIGNLIQLGAIEMFSNRLEGSIPSSIYNLVHLRDLQLNYNFLTGSISSSIANLSSLTFFVLDNNQLTGSIPLCLTNLRRLQFLQLCNNHLSGTIPSNLGYLDKLVILYLHSNLLAGNIPASIESLSGLVQLQLYGNQLTGRIPSSIGSLSRLFDLYLNDNRLTGSIPDTLGNLQGLYFLYLHNNVLDGPIPSTLSNSPLYALYLYNNQLTGSIPAELGYIPQLQTLYLSSNHLTGKVPPSFGHLEGLYYLYLENNHLSGVLPSSIANCSLLSELGMGNTHLVLNVSGSMPPRLRYLDVSRCGLIGPLPENLLALNLAYLDMSFNSMTGTLPAALWQTSVAQLLLNNNLFRGPFPAPVETTQSCTMQYVSLSNNWLTGELPSELASCSQLSTFASANMLLSGPISGLFNTQTRLTELFLATNLLTGNIEDVMESAQHGNLILNAAYNALTGPLPKSLDSGLYQSVVLTDNCLTGHLPMESLCANTNMTELLLSGLHSSSACRSRAFDRSSGLGLYSSYFESLSVGGTVAGCLFELPQLKYLALSGNYLTGSLPQSLTVQTSLQELDLSHNALEGRLPDALVQANFTLLDLSFNRLSGTIASTATDHYASNAASEVSLRVNRLSGTLPARWVDAQDIDVLTGNMFACRGDRWMQTKNSPVNDPASSTYACGSSTTNASLLATLVVGVCVAVGWAMVTRGEGGAMVSEVLGQWQHATQRAKEHMWVMATVAGVFAACMIVYAVVTETSSAYAETYIWVVSLSLQQGQWAGAVLAVWLCFVHGAFVYGSQNVRSKLLEKEAGVEGRPSMAAQALAATQRSVRPSVVVCVVLALVCVQIVPGLAVNVLYVIATTQQLSHTSMVFIAAGMALFKLTWSSGINALLLRGKLLRGWMGVSFLHTEWLFRALVYTGVFNLIVSPLVTEMLISPNCFQYVFSRIPTSSYSVEGGTCYWITYTYVDPVNMQAPTVSALPCMSYEELEATYNSGSAQGGNYQMNVISAISNGEASTIDFQAGFVYNYQCMFSLLEAFAFVFVYRYVFSLLVLPTIRWAMKRAQTASFVRGGTSSRWFQWWSSSLPTLQQMMDDEEVCTGHPTLREEWMVSNLVVLRRLARNEASEYVAKMTAMRMIFDVAVAMSFGVLFPLVGMMAVASAVKEVWTMRWIIRRLRRHREVCSAALSPMVSDDTSVQEYVSAVGALVDGLERMLQAQLPRVVSEVPPLLCGVVLFWAFALFDVIGREAGAVGATWAVVVVGLLPWWWWGLLWSSRQSQRPGAMKRIMRSFVTKEDTLRVNLLPPTSDSSASTPRDEGLTSV